MIREQSAGTAEIRREDLAYRSGWEDGRFGVPEVFVVNANLAAWTEYPIGWPTTAATATAAASERC